MNNIKSNEKIKKLIIVLCSELEIKTNIIKIFNSKFLFQKYKIRMFCSKNNKKQ